MRSDGPAPFPYMRWAKRHLTAFDAMNLGMSGVRTLTTKDVPMPSDVPYWASEGDLGDADLRAMLGARYGVSPEQVFPSAGASLANFLVYLAAARGAHVAVETPAYEALVRLPEAVGAAVSTFARDPRRAWRLDPSALARAVTSRTRLVVVTDLHNPSGAALHPEDLSLLVREARRVGARVLVDEVYLDFAAVPRRSAVHADPCVLVTNSLTKAHGLGGLRVGWVLGEVETVRRIAEWNDLVCPAHPVPSLVAAKAYLPRADDFLARTRETLRARLDVVDAWVRGRGDVSWHRPDGGITGFLRLPDGVDGDRLAEHASSVHGVRVVPGSFFQAPDHVRVSFGLPEGDLRRALQALGRALDDLPAVPGLRKSAHHPSGD